MDKFMMEAVKEAYSGIKARHGGPFGSVVVKDGKIIGRGHNRVLADNDPTSHGEVEAIRDACRNLGSHDLEGCIIYTTAEPCPMCLGACLWANIKEVRYGCDRKDTADIGFRDDLFYEYLYGNKEILSLVETDREECMKLFADYKADPSSERY